ncbi:DUF3800 domain-containing protein [Aquirufa ecclesiirivi]|uniref:DUF3800 domain-containing protein n=1 Tax=Aquirufa ecclesiirivi TaxID=2715124 RepID=A0ABT4JG55_9BACT|nr:DUF3800 domain-containing protein [Aquirufa ecclesiirivi]MCZ2474536.1 DUF3800 domain-containing protein [Aquirufa ecclesiirivi]
MGQFYLDDSVHDEAGFIIAACVYTDTDINEKITAVIKNCGFDPEIFEFKSSANYSKEPEKAKVREQLKVLLNGSCKLGIVIIPRIDREQLGFECIKAVRQFIDKNKEIKKPLNIYLDQGMFTSKDQANQLIKSGDFKECIFHLEQNSIAIKGIQLADLAAHISSIQLKDALGLVTKTVMAGENSGYQPDLEIELGFEMWATIRYTFFNEGSKLYTDDPIADATLKVEPYGLYISDLCDKKISDIAREKFGEIYLGCIH